MQVIALSILLLHLSAFGGITNTKPVAPEADLKEAVSDVGVTKVVFREVDEKQNKAREDLIAKTAKDLALQCMKANPWGARLMIDHVGEPTEDFDLIAAIPANKPATLIAMAKEQSYFYTHGYMLLRKIYEGVLDAALPRDIGERVVSSQQIAQRITEAPVPQMPVEVALVIGEYAANLKPLPEILATCHQNQWHIVGESDDRLSRDIPECREFCEAHKYHFPFPYDEARLKRVTECGFVPVGTCYRPDRVSCMNCDTTVQSDEGLGRVTGLFLTWKALSRYHKPDCARKKEAVASLTKRQKAGRYKSVKRQRSGANEYGCKLPDSVKDPREFLVYLLRQTDLFARTHLPKDKAAAQTELEIRSYAWVRGLAEVEDNVLKAEAMIQYLKEKEADQVPVVGHALAAAKEHFMVADAKKRRGSQEGASPE